MRGRRLRQRVGLRFRSGGIAGGNLEQPNVEPCVGIDGVEHAVGAQGHRGEERRAVQLPGLPRDHHAVEQPVGGLTRGELAQVHRSRRLRHWRGRRAARSQLHDGDHHEDHHDGRPHQEPGDAALTRARARRRGRAHGRAAGMTELGVATQRGTALGARVLAEGRAAVMTELAGGFRATRGALHRCAPEKHVKSSRECNEGDRHAGRSIKLRRRAGYPRAPASHGAGPEATLT